MKKEFGATKNGEKASCYVLKNSKGMEAVVSDCLLYTSLLLRLQQDSTVLLLPHPKFHLKVSKVCTQKQERQKKRTMYY